MKIRFTHIFFGVSDKFGEGMAPERSCYTNGKIYDTFCFFQRGLFDFIQLPFLNELSKQIVVGKFDVESCELCEASSMKIHLHPSHTCCVIQMSETVLPSFYSLSPVAAPDFEGHFPLFSKERKHWRELIASFPPAFSLIKLLSTLG